MQQLRLVDASDLKGKISCGDITMKAADASDITLEGTAGDISITGQYASDITVKSLDANNLYVKLQDASTAKVQAKGTITGSISDASSLKYTGAPINVDVSTHDDSVVKGL